MQEVNPILYMIGVTLLISTSIVAIGCAIMARIALYRYRFSRVINFSVYGYICIAVALGLFNVASRILVNLDMNTRTIINVMGIGLLLAGMILSFLFLRGLYLILKPVGMKIGKWKL